MPSAVNMQSIIRIMMIMFYHPLISYF